MKIKVTDIPAEGRDLQFELDNASLNRRIGTAGSNGRKAPADSQPYSFADATRSELHLDLEGSTVVLKGRVAGGYESVCARCAEECRHEVDAEIDMLLKPRQTRGPDEAHDEDLHFGYYDDREVDCGAIAEECLILALPFTVVCREDCRGLCPVCGCNRNAQSCSCEEQAAGDERFAVLRGLKVVQ